MEHLYQRRGFCEIVLFYNQSFQVKFTFLSASEYIGRLDNLCGGGWCLWGWGGVRKSDIQNLIRVLFVSLCLPRCYGGWGQGLRKVGSHPKEPFVLEPCALECEEFGSNLLWPTQHLTWWSGHHLKLIVQNSTFAFFLPFHDHEYLFSIYLMVGLLLFILLVSPPVY